MKKVEWYHGLIVFILFLILVNLIGSMAVLAYFDLQGIPISNMEMLFGFEAILLQTSIMFIFFILTPIGYLKLLRVNIKTFFEFEKPEGKTILFSILLMLSVGFLLDAAMMDIGKIYPWFDKGLVDLGGLNFHEMLASLFEGKSFLNMLILLIFIGVFPGFGEEFLFRGFMQRVYINRFSFVSSVILSGGLFGLVHVPQQLSQGVAAFLISFVLGYIYHKTRNLWYPILCHALNNSLFGIMVYIDPESVKNGSDLSWPILLVLLLIAIYSCRYFILLKRPEDILVRTN